MSALDDPDCNMNAVIGSSNPFWHAMEQNGQFAGDSHDCAATPLGAHQPHPPWFDLRARLGSYQQGVGGGVTAQGRVGAFVDQRVFALRLEEEVREGV